MAEPVQETPTPARSPLDLLTQHDMAFVVEYARSGARTQAEEKCDAEAKGDLEKRAACLSRARDQFTADVLRFTRDESGKTSFQVYKRHGSALNEIYMGPMQLTEESPTQVRMKWLGRGRGQRPLLKSQRDALLTISDESSLEVEDPELGTLPYTAKIGLVGK